MEGIDVELVEVLTPGDRPRQHLQTRYVARKVSEAGAPSVGITVILPEGQPLAIILFGPIQVFIVGSSTHAEASMLHYG